MRVVARSDTGHTSVPEARKLDQGKPRMDLIPPDELLELGALFALGAVKYSDDNWRDGDGLAWNRLYAAAQRHLNLWWAGEDYDAEDGQPHLIAAMFCCMTLRWLSKNRRHMDTRRHDDEKSEASLDDGNDPGGYVGDHGERRSWSQSTIYATAEAPERPATTLDPGVEASLPLRILLGQLGVGKLGRYVGHQEDCQGFRGEPCTCGLAQTIKELGA